MLYYMYSHWINVTVYRQLEWQLSSSGLRAYQYFGCYVNIHHTNLEVNKNSSKAQAQLLFELRPLVTYLFPIPYLISFRNNF